MLFFMGSVIVGLAVLQTLLKQPRAFRLVLASCYLEAVKDRPTHWVGGVVVAWGGGHSTRLNSTRPDGPKLLKMAPRWPRLASSSS